MTKAQEVISALHEYRVGERCPVDDGLVIEVKSWEVLNHFADDAPGDTYLCTVCSWSAPIPGRHLLRTVHELRMLQWKSLTQRVLE